MMIPNSNDMCSGKLLKSVSPVCDTADLHASTIHRPASLLFSWLWLFQKLDEMLLTVNDRKRKQNSQFIRKKCKSKRRRVSSAEHETKAGNITETNDGTELPEWTPERAKYCWRDARRVVKLGHLADQLKAGCSECKKTLNITNTMDETIQGLGSILYIQRAKCLDINAIKSGKVGKLTTVLLGR